MLVFHVYIKVKFRFLGIDWGKVEKAFRVEAGAQGNFQYAEYNGEVPANARELLNQRGVVVKLW